MIAAETPGAVPPVSEVPASQQPMDSSHGQTENDGPTRSSTSPVSTTATATTPPPHDDSTATEVEDPALLEAQKMIAACAGGDNSTIVMMVRMRIPTTPSHNHHTTVMHRLPRLLSHLASECHRLTLYAFDLSQMDSGYDTTVLFPGEDVAPIHVASAHGKCAHPLTLVSVAFSCVYTGKHPDTGVTAISPPVRLPHLPRYRVSSR